MTAQKIQYLTLCLISHLQTIEDSEDSLEQSQTVVNITASHWLQTSIDVTLLSVIIDSLTTQAIVNPIVSLFVYWQVCHADNVHTVSQK